MILIEVNMIYLSHLSQYIFTNQFSHMLQYLLFSFQGNKCIILRSRRIFQVLDILQIILTYQNFHTAFPSLSIQQLV